MKKILLTLPVVIVLCAVHSDAKISEKTLSQYKSAFMTRVIEDNPDYESRIRRSMKGVIMEGRMGIPLLDKFGLFMINMEKKGVAVTLIRFYGWDDRFSVFFVMKDLKDDQGYTMFLEYDCSTDGKCSLRDIYFSIVFEERMNEIKAFFEAR